MELFVILFFIFVMPDFSDVYFVCLIPASPKTFDVTWLILLGEGVGLVRKYLEQGEERGRRRCVLGE